LDVFKRTIIHGANRFLDSDITQRALGTSGHGADEAAVREIATGISGVYAEAMRWAQNTRDAPVPDEWAKLYLALADFADAPIREIRSFATEWINGSNDLVRAMRAGLSHPPLAVTLKFDIDGVAMSHFDSELKRLGSN
jgi:hypothetical protein